MPGKGPLVNFQLANFWLKMGVLVVCFDRQPRYARGLADTAADWPLTYQGWTRRLFVGVTIALGKRCPKDIAQASTAVR